MLYSGQSDFVDSALPFLSGAVKAGEPVLVVESALKIDLLRAALGSDAEHVLFADMSEVGANPARIIPAWHEFVKRYGVEGKRLRGIGEPIWNGRPADELAESQRHEALLNVAFGHGQPWWLLCPYDTSQLDDAVIEEALRSHEYVMEGGRSRTSAAFLGIDASRRACDAPLPDPLPGFHETAFDAESLLNLRGTVSRFALRTGVGVDRATCFVTALNEVATNSILHGGGAGVLRLWRDENKLVGEVEDQGMFDRPLADRDQPVATIDPRGLWLANQLCDLVQIRRVKSGTVFRLQMRIDPARRHLNPV